MKHILRSFAVLCVLACTAFPSLAAAQATTTATDGSTETTTVRQQHIRGWRFGSSDLQNKISALGIASTSPITIPVLFGVGVKNISPNFGDPRDGGARTHEGEDIMAIKGTPVVSPTAAVVLRTGTGSSEGNYVYTANPGGETFVYMHLDRIGEGITSGVVLQQGSLIGFVGNTGNAAGGAAHLHFEIHNASNVPIDPFPRLGTEVPLTEKITDLTAILAQTSDAASLAQFLATNFHSVFTSALAASIPLPALITTALANLPTNTAAISSNVPLPEGDLELDSEGAAVITLQNYLIKEKAGPAAMRLTAAGATGYFGAITQAAVIEYQTANAITPANGYYGASTRAYVAAHPLAMAQPSVLAIQPSAATANSKIILLTVDLHRSSDSVDVRVLQQFLNTHGFIVATSGSGSIGSETTYFGPATEAAVIKFQLAHHISPAVGYVGPLTRAAFVIT